MTAISQPIRPPLTHDPSRRVPPGEGDQVARGRTRPRSCAARQSQPRALEPRAGFFRHLQKRDPAQRQARFYALHLTPTLFGEWSLVREWGRIGSPGTVRERWFDTLEQAQAALARLEAQKRRRGYRLIDADR